METRPKIEAGGFFKDVLHGVAIGGKQLAAFVAKAFLSNNSFYLATQPRLYDHVPADVLHVCLQELNQYQKNVVYRIYQELAQMENPRFEGWQWGEKNISKDPYDAHRSKEYNSDENRQERARVRLARALHRSGAFGLAGLHKINYASRIMHEDQSKGEAKIPNSFYYSLSEKEGNESQLIIIGYINGMGTSVIDAGMHAVNFSSWFNEKNLHCVYLPTQQRSPTGDNIRALRDFVRAGAVTKGVHTRASCQIAQQWIDLLDINPERNFLQVCYSEGAIHVNDALGIVRDIKLYDVINRLRVMAFAPGDLIKVQEGELLQSINFVKKQDGTVIPFAINPQEDEEGVVFVHHDEGTDPHNAFDHTYRDAAQSYINEILSSGDLYTPVKQNLSLRRGKG